MPTPAYKFLPHTTDAYIEATGATLEEALGNAGLAFFDTICDLRSVSEEFIDLISVEGSDELGLLYNWLESLLLKFELEQKVYHRFQVSLISEPSGLRINAKAHGEIFDRKKHGAKVEVKAVTLHKMEVAKNGNLAMVRFILDL